MTIQYKIIIGIVLLLLAFLGGVWYESLKFATFKGQVEGAASAQVAKVKEENKRIEGEANDAQQGYTTAINSINDYYRSHPVVRVLYKDCSGTVPTAIDDSTGTNGSPSGLYVSPYSPNDTEIVAARLDQLQKLLVKDRVTVSNSSTESK